MEHCVESLLPGGDEVEIILVDDGSKDNTAVIADRLAAEHPGIVKVIHKENGGHGSGVNAGIEHATGLYYKVVDSDDWVDKEAYPKLLAKLREFAGMEEKPDAIISNYIYDKEGAKHKKVMKYTGSLPQDRIFGWNDVKNMGLGHYILMHSLMYRTQVLRDCGLHLPEHTFYVDNLFAFVPFPYVKKMYYMNVDFYHYFIGRSDQSVNETVMISRIDQQIRVNQIMIDFMAGRNIKGKRLRNYMTSYLDIITTVSSVLLLRSGTEENFEKKQELWQYLKRADLRLYYKLRHSLLGRTMNLPGKGGRKVSVAAYRLTQKFFGFN